MGGVRTQSRYNRVVRSRSVKVAAAYAKSETMIVYELVCAQQHRFEGWFASTADFDRQRADAMLSCPVCGDVNVEKLPSARIGGFAAAEKPQANEQPVASAQAAPSGLAQFIDAIIANTDDVGRRFVEEARRMHYDEAPKRAIRGLATADETRELLDEGIAVLPLPLRREDLN